MSHEVRAAPWADEGVCNNAHPSQPLVRSTHVSRELYGASPLIVLNLVHLPLGDADLGLV
eukprot:1580308-Prymnesium_polylepis.1